MAESSGPVPTAALLTLGQWLSPGFPVGSYAYSHGLEWAVAEGAIGDAAALEAWLRDIVEFGAGCNDAALLCAAMQPGAELAALDALARALAASRERLAETCEQGAAFVALANAVTGRDLPPMALPVAAGAHAAALGVPPALVAALYLQNFAAALVQVGVRFIPLGQTEGQVVLARLRTLIEAVADEAAAAGLGALGGAAFRGDMAALHHESMDVRIYRT